MIPEFCTVEQCSGIAKHWIALDNQVYKACDRHYKFFKEIMFNTMLEHAYKEEHEI